jgi:phage shock protein C
MLAGVAAGVAETLDADPSLVRIIWALLAVLTGGIAFVVYVVMAIVVPESPGESTPSGATWAAPGSPTAGDAAGSPPIEAAPPPAAGTASAPAAASAAAIAPLYATAMPTRAESRAARRGQAGSSP